MQVWGRLEGGEEMGRVVLLIMKAISVTCSGKEALAKEVDRQVFPISLNNFLAVARAPGDKVEELISKVRIMSPKWKSPWKKRIRASIVLFNWKMKSFE